MACPQSCTHACVPRRPSLPQASFTAKAFCRPACQRHLSKSNQHIWKWNDLTPGPVKIKWNNFWQQCVERTCERSEGPFATFKLLLDKTEYSLKRQECFRMVPIHSIPGTHPQSNIQFLDHETCVCHNTRMNDRVYIIYIYTFNNNTYVMWYTSNQWWLWIKPMLKIFVPSAMNDVQPPWRVKAQNWN